MEKKRIALLSTGGTIEKTYDPLKGVLDNSVNVLDLMLAQLDLRGIDIVRVPLMNKDSLDMTDADHVAVAAHACTVEADGVVVVHGTDRLSVSGELTYRQKPKHPVVFTGAMRPYELKTTDALQNLTEAFLSVQLLPPGVYVAIHNQILEFPGVRKARELGTFVKD